MGFYGNMSATYQIKLSKHTATHNLDGRQHVSKSNQAHKAHSNSQSGWDFMATCQYVSKSNQAHKAHRNSQSGWDFIATCQQIKSSSQNTQKLTRWMGFHGSMSEDQSSTQSTQQLTTWMRFHGSMSANQIKLTMPTETYLLDRISSQHVSKSN